MKKEMKTTRQYVLCLLSAAFAVLSVSCQREMEEVAVPQLTAEENSIAFKITGTGALTKAPVQAVKTLIPLAEDENGYTFTLEETVTDLNAAGVFTKGKPATTQNVGTLYGSFYAFAYNTAGTEQALEGATFNLNGELWEHSYHKNPWEKADPLKFYMWMPAAADGSMKGVEGAVTPNSSGGLTFSYTSPVSTDGKSDAVAQEDILFSSVSLAKDEYDATKGADITFQHALTGVKFTISNDNTIDTKTYITKVVIKGMKNSGTCTVTPTTGTHSSATSSVWTPGETTATFTQEYAKSNVISGTGYPALHDADTTMTFWVIPQELSDSVSLEITFHLEKGTAVGEDIVRTVNLGTQLNNPTWTAGQLHTFSLKGKEVVVHIEDEISSAGVKQNVEITNNGNVDCFIRAAIIGNWADPDGNAVFGYTDFTDGSYEEIEPWSVDTAINDNEFTNLALSDRNWERGTDGYFYYKVAVPSGGQTTALFDTYTPSATPPEYKVAGKPVAVHFVMEIAVQAIEAKSGQTYSAAWAATK